MARSDSFDEGELVIFGLIAAGIWIFAKGGISGAASAAGAAAVDAVVNAASGAVTGAAGAIGAQVGLPKPAQLTDDPYVSRWIIDSEKGGRFAASQWSTSSAFINALTIDQGDGVAPPANSPLWGMFGTTIDFGNPTGTSDGW